MYTWEGYGLSRRVAGPKLGINFVCVCGGSERMTPTNDKRREPLILDM